MLKQNWAGQMTAAGSPRPMPSSVAASSFPSQCLGEFLSRIARIDPHPAVLDLGVLCGDNIAFLGSRGCRVSVESLPGAAPLVPAAGAKAASDKAGAAPSVSLSPPVPLSQLSYPPESFSGILAWDAIARIPSQQSTSLVERLRGLLLSGGVVLAYFPGPPSDPTQWTGKYRILAEAQLSLEPTRSGRAEHHAYENREIYSLFSGFDVVRLSHLKSGTREVLVAKSRRS
jgi:hypothetical protein